MCVCVCVCVCVYAYIVCVCVCVCVKIFLFKCYILTFAISQHICKYSQRNLQNMYWFLIKKYLKEMHLELPVFHLFCLIQNK